MSHLELERREFFNEVITDEDLKHMEETMMQLGVAARSIDKVWKRAFESYNAYNVEKLNMNCSPCYMKVYLFLKKPVSC